MSTMVVDDGIRVRPLPEINGKTDDDPNHRGEKIQRCNPAHVIHIPQAQAKPKPLFRKKPRSRTYRLATNAVKKSHYPWHIRYTGVQCNESDAKGNFHFWEDFRNSGSDR